MRRPKSPFTALPGAVLRVESRFAATITDVSSSTVMVPATRSLEMVLRPPHEADSSESPSAVRPSVQRNQPPRDPWIVVNMTQRPSGDADVRVDSGCSLADDSWRMTEVEPPSGWKLADFDDSSWATPPACSTARVGMEDWALAEFDRLAALGCVPLAFPNASRQSAGPPD